MEVRFFDTKKYKAYGAVCRKHWSYELEVPFGEGASGRRTRMKNSVASCSCVWLFRIFCDMMNKIVEYLGTESDNRQ